MTDAEKVPQDWEFKCNECFMVLEWAKMVEHTDKMGHTFRKIEKQEGLS